MFKKDNQAAALQDVNELIREVLTLVRSEVENHHVVIYPELLGDLPQVSANRVQLRQVIVNLLMNAVDAMDAVTDGARAVRIKTEIYDPNYLLIAVEDTGTVSIRNTSTESSTLFFRPNPMAWEWGYRSAGRSSRRMADVCGPRQTYPGAPSFSSPCLGRGRPRRKEAPARCHERWLRNLQ